MKLSDLGEFGFIDKMRTWLPSGQVPVGIGDDAAVMRPAGGEEIVAASDALVEGVHFRLDWSTAADVGFKAVSVNVSDIAAMGAEPRWLLLALCAPGSIDSDVLEGLYGGIVEACALYGTELVGGDTVRANELVLAVTAIGELDGDPMLRSQAKVGDRLAVTGPLGRAAAGVNLLLTQDPAATGGARSATASEKGKDVVPEDAIACIDAHRRPIARVAEGRKLRAAGVRAALDVSDGLAADVKRLSEASEVGIELDEERLPIAPEALRVADARGWDARQMVLGGGEDLELLLSVDGDPARIGLIEIGRVVEEGLWLVSDTERVPLEAAGYDHFAR